MTLALTKRAEKGSAITIAEHDANFDAIESEVNAKLEAGSAITDLDGTAWRVIYVDGSGDVVELGLGTSGQVLKSNGASSAPSFEDETAGGGGDLDNLVEDTTPQLGGDLDVNGNSIVSASDGDVVIEPDGTGEIQLNAADVLVEEDIVHSGDTNNKIVFGTDTQDFQTGGSSRLDISDSGVRLGGANARVTTVLDEDTLSSDSATALATQQSIKAYVDEIKFTEADDATDYGGTNASFKVGSDGASIGEQRRFTDNGDHDLEFIAANLNDGDYGWLIKGGTGTVTLVYNDINLNGDTADIELKSIVKWTVHDGEVLIEGGTDEDVELEGTAVVGNLAKVLTRGAGSSQPTVDDSGAWIVTDGAITIPNTEGFHCTLEFGGDHDVTHNSITWDTGASSGDIVSVMVKGSNAIRITPIIEADDVITESDFA